MVRAKAGQLDTILTPWVSFVSWKSLSAFLFLNVVYVCVCACVPVCLGGACPEISPAPRLAPQLSQTSADTGVSCSQRFSNGRLYASQSGLVNPTLYQ